MTLGKEWYCLFQGRKEGPFSVDELKKHPRFTPDTLVWKKGFKEWVRARDVKELDRVFKDEKKGGRKGKEEKKEEHLRYGAGILAAGRPSPPPFWVILTLVLFFLLFLIFRWFF